MKQEQKAIVSPNVVVAVGYGACLDIFVDASDLLGKETPPKLPNHASDIKTKKDLLETFAYFLVMELLPSMLIVISYLLFILIDLAVLNFIEFS